MRRRYSSNGSDRQERSLVLGAVCLLLLAILVGRLFVLQVVTSARSRELAQRNWLRPEYVPGPRGRILDREGKVLAEMIPSFAIAVDPQAEAFSQGKATLNRTLTRLASLVHGDPNRYRELLKKNRRTSYNPIRLERNVDSTLVARVEEHRAWLPGISVEVEPIRRYPADSLASHVLGYIGEVGEKDLETLADKGYRPGELIGKSGIEREYEDLLRGEDGIRFVEVNALGRRSEAFNREQPVPPRPGRDIRLSLDARLQQTAEEAMDVAGYNGPGPPPEVRGACVLMDVHTGEVLAMVSRPGYNTNIFSRSISTEEWANLTRPSHPLLNRAIQAAYPPGSVFKPLTEYAAFAEGIIQPGQTLSPCFGGHRFGNRIFHCWKRAGHGVLNDVQALAESCDIYFYQLAPPLGVDGIAKYARLFHIADRTGIDLPQERQGLVPDSGYYDERFGKGKWSQGVALNLIIGQGEIQLTPIELVQYVAVLATGGRRVEPRLLKDVGPDLRAGNYPTPDLEPVYQQIPLKATGLREVRKGMEAAVEEGTAKNVRVHGVRVAGKTGTAQNPGYDHATFIAYAPADDPQVAISVVLENRGHGGSVAAPIARRVLAAYFDVPDSMMAQLRDTD